MRIRPRNSTLRVGISPTLYLPRVFLCRLRGYASSVENLFRLFGYLECATWPYRDWRICGSSCVTNWTTTRSIVGGWDCLWILSLFFFDIDTIRAIFNDHRFHFISSLLPFLAIFLFLSSNWITVCTYSIVMMMQFLEMSIQLEFWIFYIQVVVMVIKMGLHRWHVTRYNNFCD